MQIIVIYVVLLLFPMLSTPVLSKENSQFLEPSQAFAFSTWFDQKGVLHLHWRIAPQYYLYANKLKFEIDGQAIQDVSLPPVESKYDFNFGQVGIYRYSLDISIPVNQNSQLIKLKYQGCADAGLCYPPQEVAITLQ